MTNLYALALMFTVPLLALLGLALGSLSVPRFVAELPWPRGVVGSLCRLVLPRSKVLTALFLVGLTIPLSAVGALATAVAWFGGANLGVHPVALGLLGSALGWLLAGRPGRRLALLAAGIAWTGGLFATEKLITLGPSWSSQLAVVAPGETLAPAWHTWFSGIGRIERGPALLAWDDTAPPPDLATGCVALEVDRSWRVRAWRARRGAGATRVYEGTVVAASGADGPWSSERVQVETVGLDDPAFRRAEVIVVPTHLSTATSLWLPGREGDAAHIEATCVGLLDDPALLAVL